MHGHVAVQVSEQQCSSWIGALLAQQQKQVARLKPQAPMCLQQCGISSACLALATFQLLWVQTACVANELLYTGASTLDGECSTKRPTGIKADKEALVGGLDLLAMNGQLTSADAV